MVSRPRVVLAMARANPVRTGLLSIVPLLFAALQVYLGVTSTWHSFVGVGFAAVLLGYSAAMFRIHLARHRIEMLDDALPVGW